MLRADNVVCGTSSTGTGTLTLAACPGPPGGLDFDKWLKATGYNFVSTNAVLVSYTIIEYTSAAFTTAKQTEKGIGTLTLGAAIANATLARTLVQSIVTGLDTSTPAPTFAAPTAITIGTAANTLVFVGNSVTDLMASFGPYFDNANSGSGLGAPPLGQYGGSSSTPALTNGNVYYAPFYWQMPMLVKKLATSLGSGNYTGGTSNVYGAIYANNTSGMPGKLLIDFGALGTAGSALSTAFARIQSAAHASGFFLTPGLYWFALFVAFSGGTNNTPTFLGAGGGAASSPLLAQAVFGLGSGWVQRAWAGNAATANPAPDPANTTGYFVFDVNGGSPLPPLILLSP